MANSFANLAARLYKKADEVETIAVRPASDCALAIISYLAYNTPVDTSTALSNWQLFIGSYPVGIEIEAYYFGFGGTTQKVSAERTIKAAKEKLANKKPGETIYIVNFKPYIKRLNDGYSKQVAAGFVERAILQGQLKIKG
jgi:hypothetical protein